MDGYRYLLVSAAGKGDVTTVVSLLERGISAKTARDEYGQSPLHKAAQNGHIATMRVLLEKYGADANISDVWTYTPLHLAAREGHSEAVKLLLSFGASTDVQTSDGLTATDIARAMNHQDVALSLQQYQENKVSSDPTAKPLDANTERRIKQL